MEDILTERVIGSAYSFANTLGHGFLEKVHEIAMAIELSEHKINYLRQHPIKVK